MYHKIKSIILDDLIDVPASYYGTEIKDVSVQVLGLDEKDDDEFEYFSHDGVVPVQLIKDERNIDEVIYVFIEEAKLNYDFAGRRSEGDSPIVQEEVIRALQEHFAKYDSEGILLVLN